jgi:hypothetical protein
MQETSLRLRRIFRGGRCFWVAETSPAMTIKILNFNA